MLLSFTSSFFRGHLLMIFILSLCLFALKNYLSQIKSFLLLREQRQTKFDEAFNLFFLGFLWVGDNNNLLTS